MSDETPTEEYAFVGDITDYWTYTLVRDRLMLMPRLTDPAMRMYLIVRSMVAEDKKNLPGQGLRRMTIDHMCFLLTRDTGKPVSFSLMYQILSLLEDLDLLVPLDTKQDIGASQMKGKEKAAKAILRGFMVRDLPPVPYTGWRNAWDKLNHYRPDWRENPPLPPTHVTTAVVDDNGRHLSQVTQVPQDVTFQDSGTEPGGQAQEHDPFQDSGKPFQDSGTPFQEAGTVSAPTSGNAGPKEGSLRTLSKTDAPFGGGAPVDARSASTTGSSERAMEGDFVASGKGSQVDGSEGEHRTSTGQGSSKPKHTRQQLDLVRSVRAYFPPDFLNGWVDPSGEHKPTKRLPELPIITQAILDALAGDQPAASRTVQQLGARIQQRWIDHGYARRFYNGELDNLVGAACAMVRPLKKGDKYGCANPRCENGMDLDREDDCRECAIRHVDQKADRERERRAAQEEAERQARRGEEQAAAKADPAAAEAGEAPAGPVPTPRAKTMVIDGPKANEWWDCVACPASGRGEPPADGICRNCREKRELEARIAARQNEVAARYEAPEEEFASASPAPF